MEITDIFQEQDLCLIDLYTGISYILRHYMISLRKIPDNLYNQLRKIARKNNTSIDRTIISILKKSNGVENGENRKRDLSDLSGAWDNNEYDEFRTHTYK